MLCTYLTNIQTDKTPISGPSFYTFMYERSDEAQIPQTLHVFDFAHKLKVRILVCVLSHSILSDLWTWLQTLPKHNPNTDLLLRLYKYVKEMGMSTCNRYQPNWSFDYCQGTKAARANYICFVQGYGDIQKDEGWIHAGSTMEIKSKTSPAAAIHTNFSLFWPPSALTMTLTI